MREPRPSLSQRLAWLFPAVGLLVFVFVVQGPNFFAFRDIESILVGIAVGAYLLSYAVAIARDALKRRHL